MNNISFAKRLALLVCAAVFALPSLLMAQAGSLDPTFGNGGIAKTTFGGENNTIANATATSLDWHITAGLSWITFSPASGTIGVGSSANLMVSAKATSIPPKTYKDTITVTSARGNVTIPITIIVTAATSATSTSTASYIGPGGSTSASMG